MTLCLREPQRVVHGIDGGLSVEEYYGILGYIGAAISWIASWWPIAVAVLAAIAVRTLLLINTLFKMKIAQLRLDMVRQDMDDKVMH
jgi:hypothetical protein